MNKKKPNKHLIYGLIDPITDELRYIGRSSSGLNRPRQHLAPCNFETQISYCHNWVKSLIKQGIRPQIIVIEEFLDASGLNDAEQFWISYFKGLGSRLTNLTDGGFGFSDYTRLQSRKPFYEVNTRRIYQTLTEAAEDLDLSEGFISRVLHKKLKHAKGSIFRYISEEPGSLDIKKKRRYDSRDFIEIFSQKVFGTHREASEFFKIKYPSQVCAVLNGKLQHCNGHVFKYLDDYNATDPLPRIKNIQKCILEKTTNRLFKTLTEASVAFNIPKTSLKRYLDQKKMINGLVFVYG